MKISYILIAIMLFVFATTKFIESMNAQTAVQPPIAGQVTPKYVTWDQAQQINKPIAIDFYATWCGYCKRFAPVLDNLNSQYSDKYSFVRVNAEDPANKALVQKFNINSYPSFFLYNPKTDKSEFVDQSIYSKPDLLKRELDNFN